MNYDVHLCKRHIVWITRRINTINSSCRIMTIMLDTEQFGQELSLYIPNANISNVSRVVGDAVVTLQ